MVWTSGAGLIINLTNKLDSVGSGPGGKREQYWPPYTAGAPCRPPARSVLIPCCPQSTLHRWLGQPLIAHGALQPAARLTIPSGRWACRLPRRRRSRWSSLD